MEKPRISIDSISSRAFTIMTVSSEEDPDITYVHRLYTPNMNDTEDPLVQIINTKSTVVLQALITPNDIDRLQITVPNQYLTEFADLQKHDVLFYFLHQFACVRSYNNTVDTDDDDDYRGYNYAYNKTLRHFGTERILEYASEIDDPLFAIPLRVLRVKAETSRFLEPQPDESPVDILTGTNMQDLKMELII